jgi:lycopene beta-cyclase
MSYDIAIAGGGLSGLAMAMALSGRAFAHLKIALIEPRTHYVRDRTWSYWHAGPHPLEHLERSRWGQWRVSSGAHQITCRGPATYRSVDADAFYKHALLTIANAPHITLLLGESVTHITPPNGPQRHYQVHLLGGSAVLAQLCIDARPPPPQAQQWSQHFVGWEIETDTDVFDPQVMDLMDFMPGTDQGVHFFYVLPYSPRRALIECTWLSGPDTQPPYTQQLQSYIAQRFHSPSYRTVFEERGCLGLGTIAPQAIPSIGRRAGTLRASTGFAYLDTLAHCEAVAQQLLQHPNTWPAYGRRAMDAWMDRLFLRTLAQHSTQAPAMFYALFERTDGASLLRFLTGKASWFDRLKVVQSLPKRLFLHTLFELP